MLYVSVRMYHETVIIFDLLREMTESAENQDIEAHQEVTADRYCIKHIPPLNVTII